jgi:hypothetical protein
MFGSKSINGNGMAFISPSSTFFEKKSCFVYVDAMPYMLWHYNWEMDTIDGFKAWLHNINSLKVANGRIGLKMSSCVHTVNEHKNLHF